MLPTEVAPDNAQLLYAGRFDFSHPKLALCAWSACSVSLRFRGTAVNVNLGTGSNFFEVIVDGVPTKRISSGVHEAQIPSMQVYSVATNLPEGEHSVCIFKCTEPNQGDAAFGGFDLNAGATVLPFIAWHRKIEVIGDSISCGYGNEGASQNEHFTAATENAYWTYGAIAARILNADYECIAWSGKKLWPNSTIPELYDRTMPRNAASHWPGDKQKPDVILINLCTNDMAAKDLPARDGWIKAYHDFLVHLRQDAPQTTIYCALSPMVHDGYPAGRESRTLAKEWIERTVMDSNAAGDAKVHYIEFERQNPSDGIGADWHPSVNTHKIMAEKFLAAMRADLHW